MRLNQPRLAITASVNSFGRRASAHIRRQMLLLRIDALDGAPQPGGRGQFAQMNQHQHARQDQRGRVRDAFSGDVGSAAVDGFEHRDVIAHVGAGHHAQPAHQARRQIGNNVAIQIRKQQNIEGLGPHHQLHRCVIDDQLLVGDVGIVLRYFAAAAQEQPIGQLHDVGLVDGGHLLAPGFLGELERIFGDTDGRHARDHFQAGDHVLHHLMLQARVQVLGVFAEDHHVDLHVVEARLQARQGMHRPHVGVKIEMLAQRHVDALESSADRRGDRALEPHVRALHRFNHMGRQHLAGFRDDAGVQIGTLPANGNASGVDRAHGCFGHFGPNAIAGN